MADPILPDFFRAQVILDGISGLPEDQYVNSFVFRNDSTGATGGTVADNITARLTAFYAGLSPNQTATVASFLSAALVKPTARVKVYDLGKTPPRLPIERSFALGTMSGAQPLPPELAVCLSYYAGRPLPRRRGRIYLGPLTVNSLENTATRVRVLAAMRTNLRHAAIGLESGSVSAPARWCVLSGADAGAFLITGGWIDDAHDIQRRRGTAPQARELWGAAPTSG